MIVVDASWIIALRDPRDVHHEAAAESNRKLGEEEAVLPTVSFAECLVGPAKLGVLDDAARDLRAAFEIHHADGDAPVRWALLRASTGLRLPDVIVLDAALRHEARGVATFDDRLAACSVDRGLDIVGLE